MLDVHTPIDLTKIERVPIRQEIEEDPVELIRQSVDLGLAGPQTPLAPIPLPNPVAPAAPMTMQERIRETIEGIPGTIRSGISGARGFAQENPSATVAGLGALAALFAPANSRLQAAGAGAAQGVLSAEQQIAANLLAEQERNDRINEAIARRQFQLERDEADRTFQRERDEAGRLFDRERAVAKALQDDIRSQDEHERLLETLGLRGDIAADAAEQEREFDLYLRRLPPTAEVQALIDYRKAQGRYYDRGTPGGGSTNARSLASGRAMAIEEMDEEIARLENQLRGVDLSKIGAGSPDALILEQLNDVRAQRRSQWAQLPDSVANEYLQRQETQQRVAAMPQAAREAGLTPEEWDALPDEMRRAMSRFSSGAAQAR